LPVVQDLVGVEDPTDVAAEARTFYRILAQDRLRRLIRRDRNHPNIVAWGLPVERGEGAYDEYARLIREEDPTRPVVPLDWLR
jgi:beta-galactosidase/beta-glucuronidase